MDEQNYLDQMLNEWLARWHRWTAGYRYQVQPDEREDEPSIWEDPAHSINELQSFEASIYDIQEPHRTCLMIQARNLACRANVWTSQRLPADPKERFVLLQEARNQLAAKMIKKGLLSVDTA